MRHHDRFMCVDGAASECTGAWHVGSPVAAQVEVVIARADGAGDGGLCGVEAAEGG